MAKLRIGIVGAGKIARDQHVPAIRAHGGFELVGCADPISSLAGIPSFSCVEDMLVGVRPEAIAVCTPPQARYAIARHALKAGLHVLLEKPPCASVAEAQVLHRQAALVGRTLYAAWHSQHAPAIAAARQWVEQHPLRRVRVDWREDVRRWHPGQQWIWQPGGLGVFDPGINAISILSVLISEPLVVRQAHLHIPQNCAAPIAAELALMAGHNITIEAAFDFRQAGEQIWDIGLEAQDGKRSLLSMGGSRFSALVDVPELALQGEYDGVYRTFQDLIAAAASEMHLVPLQLVADAFLLASRSTVGPYCDTSGPV